MPRLYRKPSSVNALKNMPTPRKMHPEFMTVWPLEFCACPYGLYGFSMPRKSCPSPSSISVPINVVRQPWNVCQYSHKMHLLSSISVHIKCCMASTNPYSTACSSLLSVALKTMPVICLGMCALLQQMLSSFSSSTSLLLSQQECINYPQWVRPFALVDLMREGEGFSNITVEIRLDEWLRFGVSSLTLTLVIKLSFNLHLTNQFE
jgi:hypothetical protein